MASSGSSMTEKEIRHLYIPHGVSWDAQINHAHQLANYMDCDVYVHDHPYSLICTLAVETVTPNGGCVLISWTEGTEGASVTPIGSKQVPPDTWTDPVAGGH